MSQKENIIHKNNELIFHTFTLLLFISTSVYVVISLYKIFQGSAPDFVGFREATSYLLRHQNPYSAHGVRLIIIPPVSALVFIPFLLGPVKLAQNLFVLLSAVAVPLIVILSVKMVYKKLSWYLVLLFTSFSFLFFPVKFTLGMGQTNLLALAILLFGYYLFETKRTVFSGILIATAIVVKPMLLFTVLIFIFKKAWKPLFVIALSGIVYAIIAAIIFGIQTDLFYVLHVVPGLLGIVTARGIYYNQGLLGFISRITPNLILRKYVTDILSILLLGFTFFLLIRHKVSDNFLLALFLTLVLVIHTLAWQHQFVFLIFPFIYLSKVLLERKDSFLIALLLIAYMSAGWNFKNPHSMYQFPWSLLLSNQFYGAVLILLIMYVILRKFPDIVHNW